MGSSRWGTRGGEPAADHGITDPAWGPGGGSSRVMEQGSATVPYSCVYLTDRHVPQQLQSSLYAATLER